MATRELTFKVNVDPSVATAEFRRLTGTMTTGLNQVTNVTRQQAQAVVQIQRQNTAALIAEKKREEKAVQQTEAAKLREFQRSINEIARAEQRRISETVRAANQRLREEQRAAREIARINAETTRQAAAQDRIRERAARALADVQIREARRAARELERSLAQQRGSSGRGGAAGGGFDAGSITGALAGVTGRIPVLGTAVQGLTSQFAGLSAGAGAAGGSIAGIAGPIGLVVAAIGAATAAVVLLASKFFELTKQTAEFEGKFFDLSQQVGVSVETLSTLDVIASTTGGNIETVTASLAIFQKNLEDAHDPTSKEAKLLKELGVTTLDTEAAFRQALKGIHALGEGAKQTDATLQLFGRSGRFINAIVKESKGDFDAAAKSVAHLTVTLEEAAAADQFNDSLEILNRSLFNVVRNVVGGAIPVFTVFFQDLNRDLATNKNSWTTWSDVASAAVATVLGAVKSFGEAFLLGSPLHFGTLLEQNVKDLLTRSRRLQGQLQVEADNARILQLTRSILAGRPGDRPEAGKSASQAQAQAQARANKEIQLQQQALEEQTRVHRENLQRERDLDLKNIDEWERAALDETSQRLAAQQKIFEQERENARQFIKDRRDLALALREINQKEEKAINDFFLAGPRIQDEANKRRDQARLNVEQQLLQTRETNRALELDRLQRSLDLTLITESEFHRQSLLIVQQAHEDRRVLRETELKQATTSAARKIQLDNERIQSEIELTRQTERLTELRIAAMVREGAAATPRPNTLPVSDRQFVPINLPPPPPLSLSGQIDEAIRAQGIFAGLGVAISDALGTGAESAAAFAETLSVAFSGVAQAVGDAVRAFVLFGTAQGGFRKFAAEVIASIAQMAVVQALWEAAQGLAMTALTWFTGNPRFAKSAAAHFAAAATYGALGGVAAIAGRAVAGNTFQQASSGGGGNGGSGFSGQIAPTSLARNAGAPPQPQIIEHRHVIEVRSNDSHIVGVVQDNYRNGGIIREMVLNDGGV